MPLSVPLHPPRGARQVWEMLGLAKGEGVCTQGWIYLAPRFVVSLRADGHAEQSGVETEGVCEAPIIIIVVLSAQP